MATRRYEGGLNAAFWYQFVEPELVEPGDITISSVTIRREPRMICPKCGRRYKVGRNTCPNCGGKMNRVEVEILK
jgi:Zn finger protein HypA/HybF involved in hydrogenase expression